MSVNPSSWIYGEWSRALVYGLGVSGCAAARLLLGRGVQVAAVDRRNREEIDLAGLADRAGLELFLGQEPEELPPGIEGVVVSPGVPPDRPLLRAARRAGLPVISEVELAFPLLKGPVIGITGTNGKSTTTELTGAILRAAGHRVEVCGNIGEPISGRAEGPEGRVFVVELSSFQLENLSTFRPQTAALLNLSEDHLDRYESFEAYAAAKLHLFQNQESEDVAVLNADDASVVSRAEKLRARHRFFSRLGEVEDGCFFEDGEVVEAIPGEAPVSLFRREDLPLPGAHNLENAMAATLLARGFGAEPSHLKAAFRGFQGLPHRLQPVGEWHDVSFFDDSKGTNVAATAKSLEDMPDGAVHLILGGLHKGDDPAQLEALVRRKVRRLYLVGAAAPIFSQALAGMAPQEIAGTLDEAVASAAENARAGDVVLLSPACASFDQFSSYAQRGEHFQSLVRALPGGCHG